MSERYPGGIISKNAPTVTVTSAPGVWTLDQQAAYQQAGTWPYGGPTYIEDVFSTYLYTGNGSTQTITNGVNLSSYGGLVWTKVRSTTYSHFLADTIRGAGSLLSTNSTAAADTGGNLYSGFNSNGYGVTTSYGSGTNGNGATFASWTFRKQPKFFDVVTYTGNGTNRTISHNLGSTPGFIVVKCTSNGATDWAAYHRSLGATKAVILNGPDVAFTISSYWNNTEPTSTEFSVGTFNNVNTSGYTYVAYLFAHNAGGFGLTGTDNVISCGSTAGGKVTLGYEPQWILHKSSNFLEDWQVIDVMRGMPWNSAAKGLAPNTNAAEANSTVSGTPKLYADGFELGAITGTHIYIAIRRGPMKTPTTGTSVFSLNLATNTEGQGTVKTTNFPVDAQFTKTTTSGGSFYAVDRLRGISSNTTDSGTVLVTNTTAAETSSAITRYWSNTNFQISSAIGNSDQMYFSFGRAPGFFDEVCYTGNGPGTQSISHNLGVAPELVINKTRTGSAINGWTVFQGSTTSLTGFLRLNTNAAKGGDTLTVSSTTFTADSTIGFGMNTSGYTYVTYLFASCPGVSKVGSYTGTGTLTTINCGFTGGARFVMIKRTDTTGNWYIWDTTRGMVAGTDPSIWFNDPTAAQSNANSVYTITTGFQLLAAPSADVNTSGGTYIYLAIA